MLAAWACQLIDMGVSFALIYGSLSSNHCFSLSIVQCHVATTQHVATGVPPLQHTLCQPHMLYACPGHLNFQLSALTRVTEPLAPANHMLIA